MCLFFFASQAHLRQLQDGGARRGHGQDDQDPLPRAGAPATHPVLLDVQQLGRRGLEGACTLFWVVKSDGPEMSPSFARIFLLRNIKNAGVLCRSFLPTLSHFLASLSPEAEI